MTYEDVTPVRQSASPSFPRRTRYLPFHAFFQDAGGASNSRGTPISLIAPRRTDQGKEGDFRQSGWREYSLN